MTGVIAWLTGLSGAGKTTIAQGVRAWLDLQERAVEVLDGDVIRQHLSAGLGFSEADRNANVARVAYVATLLARHGVTVIVAMISPYAAAREAARAQAEAAGVRFLEVYVAAPLHIVQARDVKGLYRRAVAGELLHFTGISDPYEPPSDPDLILCTHLESVADSVSGLIRAIG